MKTAELEGPLLDYYVALAVGHVWRCNWMLEEEGYNVWQSYEQGWGNPTPPYSTDWAHCGPLVDLFHLSVIPGRLPCWDCMYFNTIGNLMQANGKTPQESICRAVVTMHFGQDVPDIPL